MGSLGEWRVILPPPRAARAQPEFVYNTREFVGIVPARVNICGVGHVVCECDAIRVVGATRIFSWSVQPIDELMECEESALLYLRQGGCYFVA